MFFIVAVETDKGVINNLQLIKNLTIGKDIAIAPKELLGNYKYDSETSQFERVGKTSTLIKVKEASVIPYDFTSYGKEIGIPIEDSNLEFGASWGSYYNENGYANSLDLTQNMNFSLDMKLAPGRQLLPEDEGKLKIKYTVYEVKDGQEVVKTTNASKNIGIDAPFKNIAKEYFKESTTHKGAPFVELFEKTPDESSEEYLYRLTDFDYQNWLKNLGYFDLLSAQTEFYTIESLVVHKN